MRQQKFRYNAAITVAAVVAFFGAMPLATSHIYLSPIALVPILVGVWGWRAGTDVGPEGVRIRALFGSRFIPWSQITALVPADRRRAYAILTTGSQVRLPAVGAADLATLGDAVVEKTAEPDGTPDGPHPTDDPHDATQQRESHPGRAQ
ncbi:PH domain-containing protein [Planosporangium thailandense]|uniref:PH domain-containing protein n=1 Tax=Planosporangium thailandense TaxID=765197 RepID=UPI0030B82C8D